MSSDRKVKQVSDENNPETRASTRCSQKNKTRDTEEHVYTTMRQDFTALLNLSGMILHFGDIIVRWTVNVHVTK